MTREQYKQQRVQMLQSMKAAIDANDVVKAHEVGEKIKELDAQWAEISREQANFNALNGITIANATPTDLAPTDATQTAAGLNNHNSPAPTGEENQYIKAFAKALKGLKLDDKDNAILEKISNPTALAGLNVKDDAVLVPTTLVNEIWKEMEEQHPVLAALATTYIQGDVSIPRATDTGDDAEWVDETTEAADGEIATDDINLTGCELQKSIPVTYKMKKMGIDAFASFVTGLLAEKNGNALAKAVISGKGQPGTTDTFKAQPKGVLTSIKAETNTPQVVTYTDTITYANLLTLNSKLKSRYFKAATYYATNTTIWTQLAAITDTLGRPIFIPDPTGQVIGYLFGRPVQEEDGVADGTVLLGDFAKGYACNANEDMALMTEDHPKARKTDYIIYSIIDGAAKTTKAFAVLEKK